jgi:glucose/mannose-6-phosphate isomerase
MGGSAIGGDLVSSLATTESRVPVIVYRGYSLPAYVDSRTLVIASSYSGNTEETLTCFEQSLKAGAMNLAITTGGRLKEMAESANVPTFVFDYKSPPRAALPYSFVSLLCFMGRLGFLRDRTAEVNEAIWVLHEGAAHLNEDVPLASNQAKQIARDLHDHLAVIYGAEVVSEVAHRWKTQINENSKAWAFYEVFPEMNHNAVVGYEFPARLKGQVHVVMLASSFLSPRLQVRYEVVGRLLKKAGISFQTVYGSGHSQLSDVMSLVLLGDYVSYYLALLNGAAPGPVHAIDYLKSELAKAGDS